MPQAQPELKRYLDKRLFVQLNGSRKVIGVLRGYDVSLISGRLDGVNDVGVFKYRS
jgi:hypothetical protein